MAITNFEFKAKVADTHACEKLLLQHNPVFVGEDHQVDTYFNVDEGRLKLREGLIEHALIYYTREDIKGAKRSDVLLQKLSDSSMLKAILETVHGIKAVVDKTRKIYFIDNIKFHFDRVDGLGEFIEVEAIDANGDIPFEILKEQCNAYARLFEINEADYIENSYSDMIMELSATQAV